MVENRAKASQSVKYTKTKNNMAEAVPNPLSGAFIASLAPELSLSMIGSTIPVIEMPETCPFQPSRMWHTL